MGGAYRAHGLGAEAAYGNPAALGLYKRYQLELSGAWDPTSRFAFGTVAVADSATSSVAAGVAYHFASLLTEGGRVTSHLTTMSFGVPIAAGIHLGASAKHAGMTGALSANAISMDAGLLVQLGAFAASVSGHNLIDVSNPLLGRYYVSSLAFLGRLFTAIADVRATFEGPSPNFLFAGGVEYVAGEGIPLRVGYSIDPARGQSWVSGGVGLISEGGGIDFGYRHELGGLDGRMFALTLRMQMQ